jgi:hypothetical protein
MVLFSIRQQICPPMTVLKIKSLRIKGLKIPHDRKNSGNFVTNLNFTQISFGLLATIKFALV